MPAYGQAPPILLQAGQNGYFFGSYNANKPNPRFAVTTTSGNGSTATIGVILLEGFAPAVGDLIQVSNTSRSSGGFNGAALLTGVSLDPVTGVGTLQYSSGINLVSAADAGVAIVLNAEVPEVLGNGKSVAVAIQTAGGQNDNGKNIAWSTSFPTAPSAVTASLQGAMFDKDTEYITIASTTNTAGDNIVISNVTQRFYRVVISGATGVASIVSKITV